MKRQWKGVQKSKTVFLVATLFGLLMSACQQGDKATASKFRKISSKAVSTQALEETSQNYDNSENPQNNEGSSNFNPQPSVTYSVIPAASNSVNEATPEITSRPASMMTEVQASPSPSPSENPKEWSSEEEGNSSEADVSLYETSLKLSYRPLFSAASTAIRHLKYYALKNEAFESEVDPKSAYSEGEIPAGKILSSSTKRIMNIDVPAYQSSSGIYAIEIGALNFPVWMSRAQNSGTFVERRLDSNSNVTIQSSRKFGDDVSLRISPYTSGLGLRLEACIAIPGVSASIPDQVISVRGKITKLIKVSASTTVNVHAGSAAFDYVRGCYATEVSFSEGEFTPKIEIKTTQLPQVANVRLSGIKVSFNDWWAKFLDSVVNLFTSSIRKKIEEVATRKAEKYRDEELTSGRWFARAHGEEMLERASKSINQAIGKAFSAQKIPTSGAALRSFLDRKCDLIPVIRQLNPEISESFKRLCHDAIDSVRFSIRPFARDIEQEKLGCYDGFGNVHQSRGAWWAKGCGVSLQIKMTVKKSFRTEARSELKHTLSLLLADVANQDKWIDELATRLNLTEDQRALIPQILERALDDGWKLDSLDQIKEIISKYQSDFEAQLKNVNLP